MNNKIIKTFDASEAPNCFVEVGRAINTIFSKIVSGSIKAEENVASVENKTNKLNGVESKLVDSKIIVSEKSSREENSGLVKRPEKEKRQIQITEINGSIFIEPLVGQARYFNKRELLIAEVKSAFFNKRTSAGENLFVEKPQDGSASATPTHLETEYKSVNRDKFDAQDEPESQIDSSLEDNKRARSMP